jgi:hypothetical protein
MVPGALSWRVKGPGIIADNSPASAVIEIKNIGAAI